MSEEPRRVKPDEVVPPEGAGIQSRKLFSDAASMVPNLVKLVGRLLRDPRVPRRAKLSLALAGAYILSPIDVIPEMIPVLGMADDLIILMFAVDALIDRAGPELVEEHWDGPQDLLELVREVVGISRAVVPKRVSVVIDRITG